MVEKKKKKDEELFTETLDETISEQPANTNINPQNNYYQMARDKEYKMLLNKEIQLENAKANAMKYSNNQIANQGFQNQGYGSSNQTNIFNSFLNALGQAQNQTSENISNINQQETEFNIQQDQNRFNNFTGLLAQTQTQEDIDNLFSDYGYSIDTKPENMSDDDWNMVKSLYRQQVSAIENADNETPRAYSIGELSQIPYTNKNGQQVPMGGAFKELNEKLISNSDNGVYKDNDIIKVENLNGEIVYLKYNNGGFSPVNKGVYNKSKQQRTLKLTMVKEINSETLFNPLTFVEK